MLCEICRKKDANVVFKTITEGHLATRAMCLDCAHRMQQDLFKIFLALGVQQPAQIPSEKTEKTDVGFEAPNMICANCGRPFGRLGDDTMSGCADCYNVFRTELASMFDGIDRQEQVMDSSMNESGESDKQLANNLRFRLIEAVVTEDYEAAVILRDQIRDLYNGK